VLNKAPDADEVPYPRFPSSGRMVMVRRTAQGLFAVAGEDDDHFAPFRLSEEDVRQFSVSVPNLIDVIRKHNGIDANASAGDDGMIPVGQKQVDGYGAVDVYLALAAGDGNALASRCLSLLTPSGVKKIAVLLPCVTLFPAPQRQLLEARGILLIPLAPLADRGSIVIDWASLVAGPSVSQVADSVAPDKIGWKGREYRFAAIVN